VNVNNIARWDSGSSQWSALGSGVPGGSVNALATSGSDVYVGGGFSTAGGVSANNIARWNGSQWFALGSGTNNGVSGEEADAIAIIGNNVYVGGLIDRAGGI